MFAVVLLPVFESSVCSGVSSTSLSPDPEPLPDTSTSSSSDVMTTCPAKGLIASVSTSGGGGPMAEVVPEDPESADGV